MSLEHEHHEPLKAIQQSLQAFVPIPARVDRDRLMFEAGRASAANPPLTNADMPSTQYSVLGAQSALQHGRPIEPGTSVSHRRWPIANAALSAISLALLTTVLLRPAPQPQIIYRDRTINTPLAASPSQPILVADEREGTPRFRPIAAQSNAAPSSNYVHTRDVALRLGLDAIGDPTCRRGEPLAAATYWELLEDIARPQVPSSN